MQPTTPRGGGVGELRQALELWTRSGQQGRTADRPFAAGRPRSPVDLQRLQGPALHRNRNPRQTPRTPASGRNRTSGRGRSDHRGQSRTRRSPLYWHSGQAFKPQHRPLGQLCGLQGEIWIGRPRTARDSRGAEESQLAERPEVAPLPCWQSDQRHCCSQGRPAGSRPDLCRTQQAWRPDGLFGCGWRPRSRLRRQPHRHISLNELLVAELRQRCRSYGSRVLRVKRSSRPHACKREWPSHRQPLLSAGIRRIGPKHRSQRLPIC